MLPVALSFSWVIFLVVSINFLLSSVLRTNERLALVERLAMDSVRLIRISGDYMFADSNVTRAELRQSISFLEERILECSTIAVVGGKVHDDVVHSVSSLTPIKESDARHVLLSDACLGSDDYDACITVGGGIMATGGRNAITSVVRISRSIQGAVAAPDLVPGTHPVLANPAGEIYASYTEMSEIV